jgi:hypothetical protein
MSPLLGATPSPFVQRPAVTTTRPKISAAAKANRDLTPLEAAQTLSASRQV